MFARMTTWRVGAEYRPELERLADELSEWLSTMVGFRTATYLADDAGGRYSSLTVWDTEEFLNTFYFQYGHRSIANLVEHVARPTGCDPKGFERMVRAAVLVATDSLDVKSIRNIEMVLVPPAQTKDAGPAEDRLLPGCERSRVGAPDQPPALRPVPRGAAN